MFKSVSAHFEIMNRKRKRIPHYSDFTLLKAHKRYPTQVQVVFHCMIAKPEELFFFSAKEGNLKETFSGDEACTS